MINLVKIWKKASVYPIMQVLLKFNDNEKLFLASYFHHFKADEINEKVIEEIVVCLLMLIIAAAAILNNLTSDADVFETAALQSEGGWKVLDSLGTMPGMLKIPETMTLPDSVSILGGTGTPIKKCL